MSIKSSLAQFLRAWIKRLESEPSFTVRTASKRWYRHEFHLPPWGVALITYLLLTAILLVGTSLRPAVLASMASISAILLSFFSHYLREDFPDLSRDDDAISLLSFISLLTLVLAKGAAELHLVYDWLSPLSAPFALGPLLAALLLPARLGVVLSFCLALAAGLINDFSLIPCAASAFGGAIAVALGRTVRTRGHVTRAGFKIGGVQAATVLVLGLAARWPGWILLWHAGWALASGVIASLIALGLLPYLESFFSRLSPIQLLEMSDLNHPLLKRMSLEAPGTYHHSLIMATLADAAAASIGANNLLARVGAYFHDIGKLMKPEYFVENQGGSRNPHDDVSPAMSRLVITSHVKEGLALAERYRIDRSISDFIPMHHGTSKVEYFYRKAAEVEKEEPPEEQSYRYPGPRPRSKETAIVMLADSIEAAARTLEEPNHQRFQDLVYRLVNRKFFDGQLDETSLTLRDLRTISDTFVTTLMGIYHARIKYPALENPSGGIIPEIRPPSPPSREA